MKRACFVCLFLFLTATFLVPQSNPVPLVNKAAGVASTISAPQPDPKAQAKILDSYGKLPLSFEANHGQADARVKFLSRTSGYMLFLTGDEAVLAFKGKKANTRGEIVGTAHKLPSSAAASKGGAVLRMKLRNANSAARATGVDELSGKSNYFIGNDPKKWWTNVPTYAKVKYEGVYSGIDLVYYGSQRQLEYDFIVAPAANPRRIQFDVRGAKRIRQDENGELVFKVGEEEIRWRKPVVYQEKNGTRQEIAARYAITNTNRVRFELTKYDVGRPLYIDPLIYSTYLGGSGDDEGYSIAVDGAGNAYVTGRTASTNFPTTNPLQAANAGGYDVLVAKINASGSTLVYSTYLGGSGNEWGSGIAVDSLGDAYVTGYTTSTNFPTTPGAFQTICGNPSFCYNVFVTEFNPTGSALVYSTYLGGSGSDEGIGIAVNSSGNAYVVGEAYSDNFPVTPGAFKTVCGNPNECSNAFVTEFNSSGSTLVYSTYLGGSGTDYGNGIAVDSSGNAYVTGWTTSTDFPTMNPFQPTYGGGDSDAFVAKINPPGSALVYSTYLGGSAVDGGAGIAVDSSGNAYVIGYTSSTNFPTMNPLQAANAGGPSDAFVTKFDTLTLFPPNLTFANQVVGTSSGPQVSTLTNIGNATLTITSIGVTGANSGDFAETDNCGTSIPVGGSCTISVTFTPAAAGTRNAAVSIADSLSDSPQSLPLTGVGTLPNVTLSPSSLNFGQQPVGTTSQPQIVQFSTNGPLSITSIATSTEFAQTNNCGNGLPAGGSCQISVTFTPTATGVQNGTLTVSDSGAGSPQSVSLTGIGTQPAVTLSPASLNFGNQTVGMTSSPKVSTLMNSGTGTLTITSIGVTGSDSSEFAETNTCGTSVPAGGSCKITVTFTPATTGTQTASVSITDNAPNSPQSIPLSGVGVLPAVAFSPASLTFPNQVVYTKSKAQKVMLTNTGLGILTISSIAATSQFSQTNTCAATLSPKAKCTISVAFAPTTIGPLTGSVSVSDNAPGNPQTVPLNGTGTYVQLKPASLNFGNQPVGTKSLPKKITLTNKGAVTVNITGISITGANASDFAQTNTCGASVASGASCFIKVTFTPVAQGNRTAQVSIGDDGGGSPQTVGLSGTGTP